MPLFQSFNRYTQLDPYTFEELRREYYSRRPRGRVQLLEQLQRKSDIPKEIQQFAARDRNAEVRQWIARNGNISEEETARLQADTDEFVRACLFENPLHERFKLLFSPEARFKEATHLERLAMMRNPGLGVRQEFVEMIFDPEDTKLGIDVATRKELVFAILSNKRAVEADLSSYDEWEEATGGDIVNYYESKRRGKAHFARLWTLAARWPLQAGLRQEIYRNVSADGETKLRAYKQNEEPVLRLAILENNLPELDNEGRRAGGPSSLLEAAKNDANELCKAAAYKKSPPSRQKSTSIANALSYAWTASEGIALIALVVPLLSSSRTYSEAVTNAVLVIIYLAVRDFGTAHGFFIEQQAQLNSQRHARLLELLRDPQYAKDERESFASDAAELQEEFSKIGIKQNIKMACSGLVWIGTIIYLVKNLL